MWHLGAREMRTSAAILDKSTYLSKTLLILELRAATRAASRRFA
jgi:hypothetical protein